MCYAKVKSGRIQVKEVRDEYGLKGQKKKPLQILVDSYRIKNY